ncbi:malto-oligosyltrehalose synthase [Lichenifustis flavocetrariae]|uniref:Malto-oligosyltrehalose synthase n=1 Tax=Lichenifustis flavocetrariae TaxID=2949735 RepID=A0AA41YUE6_9HYPH|nr:malto-oligosyltrehalose synthase [Lichenifustis flavocetrariae]MCW6508319.1 malto-oligosyltrehalose synthase [Lichenifustis flavocetrariae]
MIPRATYRLQFTPTFGFDDAAALAPYLAKLGVSHLYASPYLKARPGSTHGYDIVDHNALNEELGGADAFARMNAALKANGLGQILDFVPNHMGVGGADNPIWLDVLEWGQDSVHSGWFDIDWNPDRPDLKEAVLIPFLGEQYGAELEAGKLQLKYDAEAGSFAVWAYDAHKLPVSPLHYATILGAGSRRLERLGDEFSTLPNWRPGEHARAEELKRDLADETRRDPAFAKAIEAAVARFNGQAGDAASWSRLDALIRLQHWRPAHFRVAADDINYRRFFNIAELAGLRMEVPRVFDDSHRLVFSLLADGTIDGLRIDHIDGLLDPKGYLERLRARAPATPDNQPFYLVIEKILAEHEKLRTEWPVQGTTGYEVTNLLLGVMIDARNETAFSRIYANFSGETKGFNRILRECKKRIMDTEMAGELNGLARDIVRIAMQKPATADFTRNLLRRAIREIVANFPVYRTYLDFEGEPTWFDRFTVDQAITQARKSEGTIDPSVYEFLRAVLTGDLVAEPRSGYSRSAALRSAMKLQQYSGPVMAKGLEDTAFYRYNRFIALNEVGGHPQHFELPLDTFHKANAERAKLWPNSMLGTSTHDTKRGEDARARLAALSEIPDEWAVQLAAWGKLLQLEEQQGDPEAAPDRNDIYAILQTLVGTWPPELLDAPAAGSEAMKTYAERVKGAITKAMREAKVHSSWSAPNADYEEKTLSFIDNALTGALATDFLPAFLPFARRVAELGVQNSLVQTVLKLTLPGVPDIYQGTELWDLSMVDPDNRRPVDFSQRETMLGELAATDGNTMSSLLSDWRDGRIKLAVLVRLLKLRRDFAELFGGGEYIPVQIEGGKEAILGYRRRHGSTDILVAVARFPARRAANPLDIDCRIALPETKGGTWTDVLTGRTWDGRDISSADAFRHLPVAVLVRAE